MSKPKIFTAVFRDVTTDEAGEIVNHAKWSAGSWSHALDDRDDARHALGAANARIAELEAQIATVAPAVDAQPVAWFIADDNGEVYRATGYEHERDQWRAVGHAVFPLYASAPSEGLRKDAWQPIETAPSGAKGYCWMNLAWGPEGDVSTGIGMRWGDRFFAAGSFYCLGHEKRYEFREIEVKPTHWMPLPEAPAALSQKDPQ
jgi:hypothetical protein